MSPPSPHGLKLKQGEQLKKIDRWEIGEKELSKNSSHKFTNYLIIDESLCTCCLERGGLAR
jgi:hypothetical protein